MIDFVGYEFGENLFNIWYDNVTRIIKTSIKFVKISKYNAIKNRHLFKSIYCEGLYYLAVPKSSTAKIIDEDDLDIEFEPNIDEFYLFGYEEIKNKTPDWEYDDLHVDDDGSVWYKSTYGKKYKISNKWSDELNLKYKNGRLFTRATNSIVNSLNNFLPQIPLRKNQ